MGKRIVVKVGTSTLTHRSGGLNFRNMDHLARVLSDISGAGNEVILVSSGAIGVGAVKLGMRQRPTELSAKQAAAAVGQCELMHLYDKFFSEYSCTVAQILLSRADVDDPVTRANLERTFHSLLELGALPIVNENDSVCFDEIETEHKVFGDNDTLSAVVAALLKADLLVLLSDIDGVFDRDPHRDPDARLIPVIDGLTDELWALAGGAGSSFGTGGMQTKFQAAEIANAAGVDMVITNGAKPDNLYFLADGGRIGTLFRAARRKDDAK